MIINGKRAVAYFDILGFKARLEKTPLVKLARKYESIIKQTNGSLYIEEKDDKIIRKDVCDRYIFSDSIFLVAKEDTEESFIELFTYAWRMMQFFIVQDFPLRGAITYGELYANPDLNIFLGKAISNAVILESQQNWIGAVVDNSAINRYQNIFGGSNTMSTIMNSLMPAYDVPLKNDSRKNYHSINWRFNIKCKKNIKTLFNNVNRDKDVQIKINNTLDFAQKMIDSGQAYNEEAPKKYSIFWVGYNMHEIKQML